MWNHLKAALPKNWQQILAWCVLAAGLSLASRYGVLPPDTPIPPAPVPVIEPDGNMGWVPMPVEVDAIAEKLEFKVFADTPAGKADDPLPSKVYLWQSYHKLFARPPPSKDQSSIGSCVSFGTNSGVERTLVTQIVLSGGDVGQFRHLAEEVTYGGSRVQVGGNKIRGDGSVGAWAAQFVQKWGVVAREKHGAYDLTTYSVSTCRQFGNSGVPEPLQALAREHPIKDITQVKTWAEAKRALASGYGIAVCSNVGFEGSRNADGVKVARGSWAHCMCLDGYHVEGGKEYGHIENSWGARPNEGPVGWGDPPPSGFWAESTTIDRMLRQNDSWAFSAVKGWPSRKLDWFVEARPVRPTLHQYALFREVQYAMSP